MGNLTLVREGTRKEGTETVIEGVVTKLAYEYDSLGQLAREDNAYYNGIIN